MSKFRTKFTLLDIKPPTRLRRVRTEENTAALLASVKDDHQLSIRRRSKQLDLCYPTTWQILRKDLGVQPFKIRLMQELKPNDLLLKMQELDLHDMWFQKDGATCQTARVTKDSL